MASSILFRSCYVCVYSGNVTAGSFSFNFFQPCFYCWRVAPSMRWSNHSYHSLVHARRWPGFSSTCFFPLRVHPMRSFWGFPCGGFYCRIINTRPTPSVGHSWNHSCWISAVLHPTESGDFISGLSKSYHLSRNLSGSATLDILSRYIPSQRLLLSILLRRLHTYVPIKYIIAESILFYFV